ncbi:MAG: YbjN domain-containing protein [Spirochaetaceae bacterium]|jgi:hypothetical protein|nr:YbjN domain-containing protein [Spirochaetaceae bacterium]
MANNKIEQYLIDFKFDYEEIGENMWLLDDSGQGFEGIAIMLNEPLVVFRSLVMDVPQEHKLEFFAKLLELNVTGLLHGAYGLEEDRVVLIDTLEYATMDANEFRATLDSFSLALTQHYPILSQYRS